MRNSYNQNREPQSMGNAGIVEEHSYLQKKRTLVVYYFLASCHIDKASRINTFIKGKLYESHKFY